MSCCTGSHVTHFSRINHYCRFGPGFCQVRKALSARVMCSSQERPAQDSLGCFMEELDIVQTGASDDLLKDCTVAVKDSYDIKGCLTSNGSPTWRETHPVATATAPAVVALLQAGARVVGKTVMDEMAYSLEGQNYHYGTPINPCCPNRIPGGSSSGSAVAVAGGLAELALGGDTGGSVRIPASFCGVFGIRPTHGRVDISRSCPLAPSFDTGGWFARDASMLEKAGRVLLDSSSQPLIHPTKWLVGADAFDLCSETVSKALYESLSPRIDGLKDILGSEPVETVIAEGENLASWVNVFRICQGWEIWQTHGEWIRNSNPIFGPGIKDRFEMASKITKQEFKQAHRRREEITEHLYSMLKNNVLTIPTANGPAPKKGASLEEMNEFRSRTLALTSIAGLAGLPQVTIPLATVDGCPVGLSIIGPKGSDESLLRIAVQVESLCMKP